LTLVLGHLQPLDSCRQNNKSYYSGLIMPTSVTGMQASVFLCVLYNFTSASGIAKCGTLYIDSWGNFSPELAPPDSEISYIGN